MSKHKKTTEPTFNRAALIAAIDQDTREAWQAGQAEILQPGVIERNSATSYQPRCAVRWR